MTARRKKIRIPIRWGKKKPASQNQDSDAVDWRSVAARLQLDMENYRNRQQRLAENQVLTMKRDLLLQFLEIIDNMERGLPHLKSGSGDDQSVKATYAEMISLLSRVGVERIPAAGQAFDPTYHEAVATVPADPEQIEDLLVVEEEQQGYRLGDYVLRPARVVVAKK